ncbi:MAG: hypothetical protein R2771_03595 [Saprospiraceae bacterium]
MSKTFNFISSWFIIKLPDNVYRTTFGGHRSGWIEVITGSMFSGKTEELIRRLRRTQFANQNLIIYKPQRDTRYSVDKVTSHDENSLESIAVSSSKEILEVPRRSM